MLQLRSKQGECLSKTFVAGGCSSWKSDTQKPAPQNVEKVESLSLVKYYFFLRVTLFYPTCSLGVGMHNLFYPTFYILKNMNVLIYVKLKHFDNMQNYLLQVCIFPTESETQAKPWEYKSRNLKNMVGNRLILKVYGYIVLIQK